MMMIRSNTLGTRSRTLRWSALVASIVVMTNPLPAQTLTWLGGNFDGNIWWALAFTMVSDNGATVAARYWRSNFERGYIWRVGQQGMRELVPSSGYSASGAWKAVSADGNKVYYTEYANTGRALRWEPAGPQGETITPLSGAGSFWATGCTPDGRYLVGYAGNAATIVDVNGNNNTGAGWTLNTPSGYSGAANVITQTDNNSWVVVGHVRDNSRQYPAIWKVSGAGSPGTLERITALNNNGDLWGVSADGTKACGYTGDSDFIDAILWRQNLPLLNLPKLQGGNRAGAFHMTADGNTIVGLSTNAQGKRRAVRWRNLGNDSYQIEDLNQTYASLLWSGSELQTASAISRDGRFIAGFGYNSWTRRVEAYLLDTRPACNVPDVTGDGEVNDADLLKILFEFGNRCGN